MMHESCPFHCKSQLSRFLVKPNATSEEKVQVFLLLGKLSLFARYDLKLKFTDCEGRKGQLGPELVNDIRSGDVENKLSLIKCILRSFCGILFRNFYDKHCHLRIGNQIPGYFKISRRRKYLLLQNELI